MGSFGPQVKNATAWECLYKLGKIITPGGIVI